MKGNEREVGTGRHLGAGTASVSAHGTHTLCREGFFGKRRTMSSISQNNSSTDFPDFRNLGVLARLLIGAHLFAMVAVISQSTRWQQVPRMFVEVSAFLEPVLLTSLLLLHLFGPVLQRLRYSLSCALSVFGVAAVAACVQALFGEMAGTAMDGMGRVLVLSVFASGVTLVYFRLLRRAYSPALSEARLQALQSRIRPHFLFNSLNAVLSLIRRDPKQAERALEDLADLFRSLLSDERQFVRLADEIELLERYASIEQLRLGDRLRVIWDIADAPTQALLPPLVLQPLLENAVYHGVEPGTGTGEVCVSISRIGTSVVVVIENPYHPAPDQRPGNRIAVNNIRERLQLFFDAEARIEHRVEHDRYKVTVVMPLRESVAHAPSW
jgi:two-component system sensor histidine kinase AlgZ